MKIAGADLARLSQPLLGACAALLIAGALAAWSWHQATQAENERDNNRRDKNRIEQRLQQARGEENDLRERTEQYRRLQAAGIVGQENRLLWIEILRQVADAFFLHDMDYEFSPQVRLDPATPDSHFFSSTLHLQFQPLHEAELLGILAEIRRTAPALVLPRSCRLSRSSAPRNGDEQLGADCRMDWLSIKQPGEKP